MEHVPIPCERKCPGRTGDCHSTCEKYKEYAAYKAFLRKARMRKPAEEYSVDITMRGKNRYMKKRK